MSATNKALSVPTISDAEVAEYLEANPDFFEQHLELLESLQVPHPCGRAVSLIERQLHQFRTQNHAIRRKLVDLVEIARENDRLHDRLQGLTLELFDAGSLEDLFATLQQSLSEAFEAEFLGVCFWQGMESGLPQPCRHVAETDPGLARFDYTLTKRQPVCGHLSASQLEFLFQDQAPRVRSAAVIPLGESELFGLIGIGSSDAERFRPDMGNLFLNHIGRLFSRLAWRWLEAERG